MLVGIHQTEKQLNRIKSDSERAAYATELDAYLERVRSAPAEDSAEFSALYAELSTLHRRIVEAAA